MQYPFDEQAEKIVLGSIILDQRDSYEAFLKLDSEDFYWDNGHNKPIYDAVKNAFESSKIIESAAVISYLSDNKTLEIIGGVDYITQICQLVTSASDVNFYVRQLKDKTLLRNYLMQMEKVINSYNKNPIDDIGSFVTTAQNSLNEIASERRVEEFERVGEISVSLAKEIISSTGGDAITGYRTNYNDLDKIINGLNPGNLIVLAARPSIGKSALALNIAYNVAKANKKAVGYFSLEMDNRMLVTRLFSNVLEVPFDKIQKGILSRDERLRLQEKSHDLESAPLYFDDSGKNNIDDVIVKTKKLYEQTKDSGGLGLIVVDHIGILADEKGFDKKSDQEKIAARTRKLKQLAGELKIPIICVAQLNRDVEKRDVKIPQLSDLRQSGSIEQDADQVLLLYRKSYYKDQGIDTGGQKKEQKFQNALKQDEPESDNNQNIPEAPEGADILSITVAKNRNGECRRTFLFFFKAYGRFENPTDEYLAKLKQFY
ncbi:MAG: replicative DNA helicase [Erysipelotrichaceae bacterium]|jgi:replicative DNA helicase|nr:replicative DNA helicase [Erysipelotrichaceae bacterium]MCB9499854.1 replicative DNA helicase [Erysipelotrichaceae bacterium]